MIDVNPQRLPGVVFSTVLIVAFGWLAYKGIELTRFDRLHKSVGSALARDVPPSQAELVALKADVTAWGATSGVRYLARSDDQAVGKALFQTPAASIDNAIDVIKVDPVDADPWMDIAEAAWANPDTHALSFEAWAMSSIVAPRELPAMQRRIIFLMAVWPDATEAQKRRMFFEVDTSIGQSNVMRIQWRRMLAALSEERRRLVEDEFRVYNPAYKR